MLRLAFVSMIVTVGTYFSFQDSFFSVLFYLWNAYFRPEELVWSDSIRALRLSYIIGAYAVISTILSKKDFPSGFYSVLLTVFFLHTLLSLIFSKYTDAIFDEWVAFAKIIMLCYLILMNVTDLAKIRLTLLIIVLSLGLEGAKQGWFSVLTFSTAANTNSIPFLGDNNGVAVGMAMLVPVIVLLAKTSSHRWHYLFYLVIMVGVIFRVLYTFSRGGFIALIALFIAAMLLSKQKFLIFFCILIFFFLALLILPTSFWDKMDTIQSYDEVEDQSALGRFHFWNVAVKMADDNHFLGIGPNAYPLAFDTYDETNGAFGRRRHVHSTYFGVLAELGYVGSFLFTLIILTALYMCLKIRFLLPYSPNYLPLRQTALALEVSLVAYLAGTVFLTFQYQEMFWHFIALTFAAYRVFQQEMRLSVLDVKKNRYP